MPFVLPMGGDFADGETQLPVQPAGSAGTPTIVGTPLPTANLFIYGGTETQYISPEEPPGSPEVERAEQCTCSHTLIMDYNVAYNYVIDMGRGTVVTDSIGETWRILSSKVKRLEGTKAELSYVMECISFDSPPDDFDIQDTSLDLFIIKHPRYWWALNPANSGSTITVGDIQVPIATIQEAIIRMIQNYIESPFYPTLNQTNSLIQVNIVNALKTGQFIVNYTNPNYVAPQDGSTAAQLPVAWSGTNSLPAVNCPYFLVTLPAIDPNDSYNPINIALAAAKELISKLWRQEDTPYIPAYEFTWTQRFFSPIYLNPGGYVEDPRDVIPEYFLNPYYSSNEVPRGDQDAAGPVDGDGNADTIPAGNGATIFDYLTFLNPQLFSDDGTVNGELAFSCLRKSDTCRYERTWFAVTHKWLIAPVGKWDADLYTQDDRPQNADDFNTDF